VRKFGAILVVLMLLVAVGIAYEQCCQWTQNCPKSQEGCDGSACSSCVLSAGCDGCPGSADCDNCPMMTDQSRVKKVTGTVRYIRSTNKAVKVMNGDQGMLLRVSAKCSTGCTERLKKAIGGFEKGQQVTAWYWDCPATGKAYLANIKPGADATTGSEGTSPAAAGCGAVAPSCGGCSG